MELLKKPIVDDADVARKPLLILYNYLDFAYFLLIKSHHHLNNQALQLQSCSTLNAGKEATLSIKHAMSVAATIYATDCVTRMAMNITSYEFKSDYFDPAFDCIYDSSIEIYNVIGDLLNYFNFHKLVRVKNNLFIKLQLTIRKI